MYDYLDAYGTVVPKAWLDLRKTAAPLSDHEDFLASEQRELRDYLDSLAGEARAACTLAGLRNPALKALWWFASRQRPLPPSTDDAAEYLAYLTQHVDTIGAVECARNAISYLCVVNNWDKGLILGGRAGLPLAALQRRHVHQLRKTAGLTRRQVRAIMRDFTEEGAERRASRQWRLAIGIAIGTSYKVLARYDDLRQLRYDDDFFWSTANLITLLCRTRKNNQELCTHLCVARPENSTERGVYHALRRGKKVFGWGYILPHIDDDGKVHRDRPMEYKDYVRFLRHCLVYSAGLSEEEAAHYAGHSGRAGAGSEAARARLAPHEICHLAGVKDINWLLCYMRQDESDRLRTSRALGL